jgi:3-oxoacyl-[acyl-carrier protein] reductase
MILVGRVALVTGGTHGIGRAIVDRFRAEGARVATIAREAPADLPADVAFERFDLGSVVAIPDMVRGLEAAIGRFNILVNNAGIWRENSATDFAIGVWEEVLAVNLTAPVLLATCVARGMAEHGYGRIVNVTSIHGQLAAEGALAYAAAKAGLEQATRNLAVDLAGSGILVNAVAPGFVSTRLSVAAGTHERDTDWYRSVYVDFRKLPLRRHAEPEEIAPSVVWLASDQNTYITGQVLGVDGGLSVTF